MKELTIRQQLDAAFALRPDIDGILHGLRRIKQGKHGSRSSLFFSVKNASLIPVESQLERAFCYVLEADQQVYAYRTQSLSLTYLSHDIYPDFQVRTTGGEYRIFEVKPAVFQNLEENLRKAHFVRQRLASEGIGFSVINETHCSARHDYAAITMLYDRGGRYGFSLPLMSQVQEVVAAAPGARLSVATLRNLLRKEGMSVHLVEASLFNGMLRSEEPRLPISSKTELVVVR